MAQQVAAQARHDVVGRPLGREVPGAVQHGADEDGQARHDDGGHDDAERRVVQEGPVHHVGDRNRLDHHGEGAQRAQGEGERRDPPQAGYPGRELRLDQARPTRASGNVAHRLNVVSFTSTARPMRPSATAWRAVRASSQVAAVRAPSGRSATMAVRTGSSPSWTP